MDSTRDLGSPRLLVVSTLGVTVRAFLLPFARHFRQRGFKVYVMASGVSADVECQAVFDGCFDVPWSRNPLNLSQVVQAARVFRNVVKQGAFDIIHVHTPVAAFVTRCAMRGLRKQGKPKVIYTAHGFHFHKNGAAWLNGIFLAAEKVAGRWTDYLVVINREDEEAAKRFALVPEGRIRHFPGIGIDVTTYCPGTVSPTDVERARSSIGVSREAPFFLMVAEFTRGKRHRDAIHALARLGRSEVHLVFAGTGPLQNESLRLAKKLGVEGQVHFLGFRQDIPALMRAATATVLPSEREGLARSVMESLALEVPVIGSDARGVKDLLENGAGLVVPVGDVDGLARAMAWVLDHPAEARAMARRGREQVVQRHELSLILKMHEDLYAEALSS